MKLGLLQCDSVEKNLQPQFGDYPDFFERLFKAIDAPLSLQTYNVIEQIYPKTIDECDAYLITGSSYSAYQDLPWIKVLKNFVVTLHQKKKKLIGICFGHQLIAQTLGGKVEKSPKGWCIGTSTLVIKQPQAWMLPPLEQCALLACNQDQVTILPKGAALLAGNDFCPYAAFSIGQHILTCQMHPEFSKEYAEILMQCREIRMGSDRVKEALQSLTKPLDNLTFAKWMVSFLQ